MQIGTKFSVAIHVLLSVEVFKKDYKVTSDFIASSVNTNPVVIRRLMSRLRKAGLIEIARGTGGIELTRPASEITFRDIYSAIEPEKDMFKIHQDTAPGCPVGGNIDFLLQPYFTGIQFSFYKEMQNITLADLISSLQALQKKEVFPPEPNSTLR